MNKKLYSEISSLLLAIDNCKKSGNEEWCEKHKEKIWELCKEYLPSGSGFDSGCQIDLDKSNPEKLVFYTSFHHMDSNGYYCGWTDHAITVKPSLFSGFKLSISGRDKNETKDYMYEMFDDCLRQEVAP